MTPVGTIFTISKENDLTILFPGGTPSPADSGHPTAVCVCVGLKPQHLAKV